jgi:hypothetical protein
MFVITASPESALSPHGLRGLAGLPVGVVQAGV